MTHEPLTDAELARLRAAGIEYPWHPRQMLALLDRLERSALREYAPCDEIRTIETERARLAAILDAVADRVCLDCLCYQRAAEIVRAGEDE